MKNTLKPSAMKGVLFAASLFASAAFCEVSYGSLTDMRDGKTYRTVKIGTQTWMAENLNYAYNEGTARSYCNKNMLASCRKFGRLYTRAAAMDSAAVFGEGGKGCGSRHYCFPDEPVRGVCPEGWHLPSDAEWDTLEKFVADSLFGGKRDSVYYALKSTSGWSQNGSDAVGFGILPAVFCDNDWMFNCRTGASFWNTRAASGLSSVRCVKD